MGGMNDEFKVDPSFQPWGPFISPEYELEAITVSDIIIASIVWGFTCINVFLAIYLCFNQTQGSRSPIRSVYVWMIWLELAVSFFMGLECFLHLLKIIRPSFAFYFTILFFWCIQVQLLLQIIINRIRVIVPDRKRSRDIMIATAVFVTIINISVFNIWIPARLQISDKYHIINEYWDRIEKALYLIVDAGLNWYFLKTVKNNLINNGLTKYNKLVRFNQQIVMVSLLMDVMIIAAMSIPNSFVYIQFHPLAYLVKLNIEMTMANLIKRIAISTSRRTGKASIADEFKSSSNLSATGRKTTRRTRESRADIHELTSIVSYHGDAKGTASDRVISFAPAGNQIKETREVIVSHEPNPFFDAGRRTSEVEITGAYTGGKTQGFEGRAMHSERRKSMDSIEEGNESLKSLEPPKRAEDSDDEAALVGQKFKAWARKDG
ncbi:hypothetical protein IAQ61_003966 [Plenodomus lingam]|uniref:Integral membrane protein n=1 Tax=Leptosphaeria maculans (strain JN3 / isolate v23.1.3 / race Av1-4-5-6-7-8) TaxID=985895 RepID=E4ZQT9_LEPMJ|nr:hypothetical protein LEMA_P037680.1 [Plenodomus lingam JN3]KAH9874776.1 hypothetical protein IAQ61_003966 [Plenodomus lingam]CBX94094.1 hypothetical protein LEMA_P037680.1 [Plenodomus lingam JN3]